MPNSTVQEIEYLKEFGKFLEELWRKRNPKPITPRINMMRLKQAKKPQEETKNEETQTKDQKAE